MDEYLKRAQENWELLKAADKRTDAVLADLAAARERVSAATAETDGLLSELRATQAQLAQRDEGGRGESESDLSPAWRERLCEYKAKVIEQAKRIAELERQPSDDGGRVPAQCCGSCGRNKGGMCNDSGCRVENSWGSKCAGWADPPRPRLATSPQPAPAVVVAGDGDVKHLRKTVAEWGGDFEHDRNLDDCVMGAVSRARVYSGEVVDELRGAARLAAECLAESSFTAQSDLWEAGDVAHMIQLDSRIRKALAAMTKHDGGDHG